MKKSKLKKLIREELKSLIREAAEELVQGVPSEDLDLEPEMADGAFEADGCDPENTDRPEAAEKPEEAEPVEETEQQEDAEPEQTADTVPEEEPEDERTAVKEKLIRKWLKAKEYEKREIIEKARLYAVVRCDSERVNLDEQTAVFKVTPDNIEEYMDQDSYQEWLFWNELVDLEMHLGEVYVKSVFGKAPIVFDTDSYGAPEQENYTARVDFLKDLEEVIELLIVYTDDEGRKMIEGKVPWIAITDPEGWKTRFLALRPEKPEPEIRK